MAAAHNDIFMKTIGVLGIDIVKKCVDKPGTESVVMGSVLSYYSIEVDVRGWNLWKYSGVVKRCAGTPNRRRAAGYNNLYKQMNFLGTAWNH